MGSRSLNKYLYDIQQSIDSIYEYLGEKRDFFEYERNKHFVVPLRENLKLLEKL